MSDNMDSKSIFAIQLKNIMIDRGKIAADLARDLQFPTSTISTWCLGKKLPRMGKLQSLANYFDVPITYFLKLCEIPPRSFKSNEKSSIDSNINTYMSDTLKIMARLSEEGQGHILHHAEWVEASGKYNQAPMVKELPTYTELYSSGGAAAGTGYAYNDVYKDVDEQYRVILSDEVPKHDLVLDVKGNSMFPTIYDGDVIFVKKDFDKVDHKIYALEVDGETLVKRVVFGSNHLTLISDNPDWGDRVVRGFELEERTFFIGQVIGWETPIK